MALFISSGYCLLLAFMILVLPLKWIMPAMAAAFIHELCHYLAIVICSSKTTGIRLYSFSACMELPEISRGKELLCALAGPLGGLTLWFLSPWCPRLAICAVIQSAYNLLPIYPLDGGRLLRCFLALLMPPAGAEFTAAFIQWLSIGCLLALSVYIAFAYQTGLFPLLAVLVLAFRAKDAKMPCNSVHFALQ